MNIKIRCPCCNNFILIHSDSSDHTAAFLFDNTISKSELSDKFGIELGIVEEGM